MTDIKSEAEAKEVVEDGKEVVTESTDSGKRKMNWVFTWNNYTEEDVKDVNETWMKLPDMKCVVYEKEVGAQGTPHLQGFFCFTKIKSFKQVKGMLPAKVYFAQMRKAVEANVKYVSKDGGAVVLGELPKTKAQQGEAGKEYIGKHGHVWDHLIKDVKGGMTYAEAAEKYPDMHGQYPKGFREKFDLYTPRPQFDIRKKYAKLFLWQTEMLTLMEQKADERAVFWVWSKDGAVGKSDMLKHLVSVNGFQPLQNAPTRDLSCAWKGGDVVFDYSRDEISSGQINYSAIEHIKNRLVFSPKYESATKFSEDFECVHVVCFSNTPPDVSKLSKDRWHVYRIEDEPERPMTRQNVVGEGLV
jgi:hypothetical protein